MKIKGTIIRHIKPSKGYDCNLNGACDSRVEFHRIFEHRVSEANPQGELEVMHQCSNDADERLDTLRHHFNERIRVAGPRWIVELLSC